MAIVYERIRLERFRNLGDFSGRSHVHLAALVRNAPSVPTWNYVTVHAYGRPKIVEEPERVRELLDELIGSYEGENGWNSSNLSEKYMDGMMRGIVAFEIEITRLEGKMKLSQNRGEPDRHGVIAGLETSTQTVDHEVARRMSNMLEP